MNASPAVNGLGSFALTDDQIYEYEKSIGDAGGIADLSAIRERMEKLGRFGDDTLAHVETGELIVPKPLLDKMPELKESILGHLRDMGVEDPERYIVGSIDNSINPETGSPEFFFKAIGRAVKKAVKSVGKVLKKVAPMAITVAGTALLGPAGLGMSTILAGALSSGIGTLVGGGSIKDALFSAAIGGATAGIAPSIGDVAAGALGGMARGAVGGGDIEDILLSGAMGAGGAAVGKLAGPSVNRLLGGTPSTTTGLENLQADFTKTGDFFDQAVSGQFEKAFAPTTKAFESLLDDPFALKPVGSAPAAAPKVAAPAPAQQVITRVNPVSGLSERIAVAPMRTAANNAGMMFDAASQPDANIGAGMFDANLAQNQIQPGPSQNINTNTGDRTLFQRASDLFSAPELVKSEGPGQKIFDDAAQTARSELLKNIDSSKLTAADMIKVNTATAAAGEKALADAQPGFFGRNRGLLIGGGIAGAAALPSLMEVPEMEEPDLIEKISPEERAALVAANRLPPGALLSSVTSPRQTRVATALGSSGFNQTLRNRFPGLFSAPIAAAEGGGIFPRRTGGIMPDEGIPGKDSVKAMVMPGEFIFTTKAVKGAGNGDLQQGINNMYSVMRNLEARGERVA